MNFNDRSSYLQFVRAWKAQYVQLSANQRNHKHAFNAAQRDDRCIDAMNLAWQLRAGATQARELLKQRQEGKQLAQQQYLAARAGEAGPVSA